MLCTCYVLTLLKLGELRLLTVMKCSGISLSENRPEGERYVSIIGSKLSLSCDDGECGKVWDGEKEGGGERGKEREGRRGKEGRGGDGVRGI